MTFHDIRKKSAKLREGSPAAGASKSWVDLLAWSPAPKGKRSRVFPKEGEDQGELQLLRTERDALFSPSPAFLLTPIKEELASLQIPCEEIQLGGKILPSQQPGQESTLGSLGLHFYESITHLLSMELFLGCCFFFLFLEIWGRWLFWLNLVIILPRRTRLLESRRESFRFWLKRGDDPLWEPRNKVGDLGTAIRLDSFKNASPSYLRPWSLCSKHTGTVTLGVHFQAWSINTLLTRAFTVSSGNT